LCGSPGICGNLFTAGDPSLYYEPDHKVPTDPEAVAKLVGNAFFQEAAMDCNGKEGHNMLSWNYGGALLFDGMWQSIRQFGFSEWIPKIDRYLDAYTKDPTCRGYKLAHDIPMPFDGAVGDQTGLFPIAYLQRALHNKALDSQDMAIANLTANHYILDYPHRLPDGTFSRTLTGSWGPQEKSDKVGSILWGDDQTMGTVLVARMAPLFRNKAYAQEVTRQQIGFADRLIDPRDGLGYHGFNAADGRESCCKWGRANGWGMLGHAEALESRLAYPEGYPDKEKNDQVDGIFRRHAAAFKASQSPDGRWHQVTTHLVRSWRCLEP